MGYQMCTIVFDTPDSYIHIYASNFPSGLKANSKYAGFIPILGTVWER